MTIICNRRVREGSGPAVWHDSKQRGITSRRVDMDLCFVHDPMLTAVPGYSKMHCAENPAGGRSHVPVRS